MFFLVLYVSRVHLGLEECQLGVAESCLWCTVTQGFEIQLTSLSCSQAREKLMGKLGNEAGVLLEYHVL